MPYDSTNRDWFYTNTTNTTTNFAISIPISITPSKKEVGNWTINFTVFDNEDTKTEPINLYVNFTESNVTLDTITNLQVYENINFELNATDEDLLIWDNSVKDEFLTFASNTSWVTATNPARPRQSRSISEGFSRQAN